MGRFLESEKVRQIALKASSPCFSPAARLDGNYKGNSYPFCLPNEAAEENLLPEIRQSAPAFFSTHGIKWHDGQNGKPSNHLCDSQVCCVNFLFPFADKPEALAEVFRPIFPELNRMLPVEDGHFDSFEWIGQENYLGEKIARSRIYPSAICLD